MSFLSARRIVFVLAVLVTLGLAATFGGMVALPLLIPGFMGMPNMHHFSQEEHRVHDTAYALLNGIAVVGMLVQLRAPARNAASQLMALVPFAALLLTVVLTNSLVITPPWVIVGLGAVLTTMFHPIGDPLVVFRGARPDRALLVVVALAAVPLLAFAWTMIGLQRAGGTEHALAGHYGDMAALCFSTIGVGLLASARPADWHLPASVAGALPIALGIVSLAYPDADSALSTEWAVTAIAWGVLFVVTAEIRGRVVITADRIAPEAHHVTGGSR